MSTFYQAAAGVLLACILSLTLSKQGKELGIVLSIAVCCMVLMAAAAFLGPVISFLQKLVALGELESELIQILFKVVSIGLIAEIAGLVCKDAGNDSMGKALGMLGTAVILWLSIPVFNELLELIREVLGEI